MFSLPEVQLVWTFYSLFVSARYRAIRKYWNMLFVLTMFAVGGGKNLTIDNIFKPHWVYICIFCVYTYKQLSCTYKCTGIHTCYNGSLNTPDSVFFNVSTFSFTNVTELSVEVKLPWWNLEPFCICTKVHVRITHYLSFWVYFLCLWCFSMQVQLLISQFSSWIFSLEPKS